MTADEVIWMGRKRSRSLRDADAISNPRLSVMQDLFLSRSPSLTILREIEDRREFHPEPVTRPARSFSRSRHRLVVPASPARSSRLPVGVQFEDARQVAICVRRKQRREVLHALRRVGRGGAGRNRRKGPYTDVKC